MKLVKLQIDNNNPAIIAYQEAFKRGYANLSEEQKAHFDKHAKEGDVQSEELRKLLKKKKFGSGIKKNSAKIFKE
jgi:hypothetical protein